MILKINTTHHYKFMCPLYSHMESLSIIIMSERRRFHLLITPHLLSPYIISIDSTSFAFYALYWLFPIIYWLW